MNKRYIYFYFMKREPEKIKQIIPSHIEYWHSHSLENYLGGPFADRTGGSVTFDAPDLEKAMEYALNAPFNREDVIENKWVKEWVL